MMAEDRSLLTVGELSKQFRLTRQTIAALVKQGKLPAVRLGRSVRFLPATIEAILQAGAMQKDRR